MLAEVKHFKKDDKGNTVYEDKKPVIETTRLSFPLEFGYGSYNEPKKIRNISINIDDIVSINLFR